MVVAAVAHQEGEARTLARVRRANVVNMVPAITKGEVEMIGRNPCVSALLERNLELLSLAAVVEV